MVNPAPQTEESQHVTTPEIRQTQTGRADWSADTADPQMHHLYECLLLPLILWLLVTQQHCANS